MRRRDATTLWLPIEGRGAAWAAAGVLLVVYLLGMARELSIYDSAELAMVAKTLGLGHPIGQPLHTLLGFLASHVPGVAPLTGLAALSAIPAALCALPAISLVERLAGRAGPAAAIAVGLAGLHASLWEPATRVEVYALATFFALHAVARALDDEPRWLAPGIALGLAASANPYTAIIAALAVAPLVLAQLVRRRLKLGGVLAAIGGGLLGLVPYAYLPLVAARHPETFVWGDPSTGLLRYLTGADYALSRGAGGSTILEHVATLGRWSLDNGLLPLVVAGLAGHALLVRRRAAPLVAAGIALALSVLLIASNAIFYPEISDYLGYLGLAIWLAAVGVAAAVSAARGRLRIYAGVALAAVALDVAISPPGPLARTRHRDHVTREIAEAALAEAPPGAILVVESDHWAWPLLYLQEAEGRRPDVVIFPYGLSSGRWLWQHLYRRHPELPAMPIGPGPALPRAALFLEKTRDRPQLFELVELARAVGTTPCVRGWLVATGRLCDAGAPDPVPAKRLAAWLKDLGEGSPPTHELLAQLALVRGKTLWELGHPEAALDALLAGVPADHRPRAAPVTGAPPLRTPLPGGDRAIGHPSQNLVAAALLYRAAGATDAAEECLRLAADLSR